MSSATTLPWFGGEQGDSIDALDASCFNSTSQPTAVPTFNPTYSRCSIFCDAPNTGGNSPTWGEAATFWFHCVLKILGGDFNEYILVSLFDGATEVGRLSRQTIIGNTGIVYKLYSLQAGVLTLVGTHTAGFNLETIDVELVAGASGVAACYFGGTLVINGTGLNHAGFNGVTQVGLRGGPNATTAAHCFSQLIGDTTSTVGRFVQTYAIDTLSATNNGWTGVVGNVNEIVTNDSAFISAAAANLIDTFFQSGLSFGSLTILGVAVNYRIQCGPSGPQNVQSALRVGAANFFSSTLPCATAFQATCFSWSTNPATSAAWTASAAAAIEGGAKSIT